MISDPTQNSAPFGPLACSFVEITTTGQGGLYLQWVSERVGSLFRQSQSKEDVRVAGASLPGILLLQEV